MMPDEGVNLLRGALKNRGVEKVPGPDGWFGNAMKQTGNTPQKVEGDATLRVKFDGLPKGAKTDTSMDGMFRKVSIDRGRSMKMAEDAI